MTSVGHGLKSAQHCLPEDHREASVHKAVGHTEQRNAQACMWDSAQSGHHDSTGLRADPGNVLQLASLGSTCQQTAMR